jgi:hypothetical protein
MPVPAWALASDHRVELIQDRPQLRRGRRQPLHQSLGSPVVLPMPSTRTPTTAAGRG